MPNHLIRRLRRSPSGNATGGLTRARRQRSGTAAVELAVCLPPLVMLVLASIEACNMIFLDHTLVISGYEAIRVAIQTDGTTTEARDRATALLTARNVQQPTITFTPANVANVDRGQPVSVEVTAPCDANAVIPPWFFGGRTLSSKITMIKE